MARAYLIEGHGDEGLRVAREHFELSFGAREAGDPDVQEERHGLFSVEDARRLCASAGQGSFGGKERAFFIQVSRMYHEAQNALLKLFEEPPAHTHLYLIVPSSGGVLPTLLSRVETLSSGSAAELSDDARVFVSATREKRAALAKKLAEGRDDDERRENRDRALAILDGIERAAYARFSEGETALAELLKEVSVFRGHLHDRSAPVRMILEHLAIVTPKNLVH